MKGDPSGVVVVEEHCEHITQLTSGDMPAPREWALTLSDERLLIRQFAPQTQPLRCRAQRYLDIVTVFCDLDLAAAAAAAAIVNFLCAALPEPSGAH